MKSRKRFNRMWYYNRRPYSKLRN